MPEGTLPLQPGSYSAEELAELERRERMSGWLLMFFGGAALATAALAIYLFSDDVRQNDQYERLERDVMATPGDDTPFAWGQEPIESEQAGEIEEEDRTPTKQRAAGTTAAGDDPPVQVPTTPQTFDFPAPPAEAAIPSFAGPPAGSVDRETNRALRSGKAQLWRERGQRGYVLVSSTVTYGTRECRQVSYTRFEQGQQVTSPSSQWCRLGKSGKWRLDPRGPE